MNLLERVRNKQGKKLLKNRFSLALTILLLILTISSCKKRKAFNSEDGQDLVDVTSIRSHTDLVLMEANEIISGQFFLRGKSSSSSNVLSSISQTYCAMTIDTSLIYGGKLSLNYSGNICDNLKREGRVVISIVNYPVKKWKDKGAILKVEFIDYLVTIVSENKTIKISGEEYITNESGGTLYELKYLNQASLVHSITGNNIKVVFDKVHFTEYNVGRRITYTINNALISASSDAISTQGSITNVDCWGQTRDEKNFTNQITKTIVWNTICTSLKNISGEATLKVDDSYFDLKALYGTDEEGNSTSSSNCVYSWKMTWTLRNKTKKRVFNY